MDLRSFQPADAPHLLEICLQTGDAGSDARETFSDPELVGLYFAAPYPVHDADLCLILEDASGPCGYILGALDTAAFIRWFNAEWLPPLRARYAGQAARPGARDQWLYDLLGKDATIPKWAEEYPAHLHIDLLPRAQRQGWGRRLMQAWADRAVARGASAFHLGVAAANTGAISFYSRMGLERLGTVPGAVFLGAPLPLAPAASA